MRSYLITTAILFAVIVVFHIARLFGEWTHITSDGWELATIVVTTVLAAALSLWAIRLLRGMPKQV